MHAHQPILLMHSVVTLPKTFFGFVPAQFVVSAYLFGRQYREGRKMIFQMRGSQGGLRVPNPLCGCF